MRMIPLAPMFEGLVPGRIIWGRIRRRVLVGKRTQRGGDRSERGTDEDEVGVTERAVNTDDIVQKKANLILKCIPVATSRGGGSDLQSEPIGAEAERS